MKSSHRFFVCGGGTGGHFFSGVALAELFLKLHPEGDVFFVGTRYGIEARYELKDSRMKKLFILSKGVKGKSILDKILALCLIFCGIFQSIGFLIRYRPTIVAGVGGYASAPTVFAAVLLRWLFRWKVFVLDQNSSPGLVNKIFSRFPLNAYCAFPFKGFQLVDLPLRQSFLESANQRRPSSWPAQTILVLGGSQGAKGLNDRWIGLLPQLKQAFPNLKVLHQTGKSDEDRVRLAYQSVGLVAEVFAFSDDMPRLYSASDLVVCRAGAMSVFEVLAFNKPAIFVPFPKAADDHQTKNAQSVQVSDWVLSEQQLSWDRLYALLNRESPAIPARSSRPDRDWTQILS